MINQSDVENLERTMKHILNFLREKGMYRLPDEKNLLCQATTSLVYDPIKLIDSILIVLNENGNLRAKCGQLSSKIQEWEKFWVMKESLYKLQIESVNSLQSQSVAKDQKISALREKIKLLEEGQAIAMPKSEIEISNPSLTSSDLQWLENIPHPSAIGILGKRGSGKTATGFELLELLKYKLKAWVFGFPQEKRKLLPDYVGFVDNLEDLQEIPEDSVVLFDEAHLHFHSRRSQNEAGLMIGSLLNLSRQKGLTLIFIMQESRQVDKNIISGINVFVIRDFGMHQMKFDRPELKDMLKEAKNKLASLPKEGKKKTAYLYSPDCDFAGLMEISLPTFWSEQLSRAYGQAVNLGMKMDMQFPKPTPKKEKIKRAKELRNQGYSFGKIAKMLGIKKTTAYRYANTL